MIRHPIVSSKSFQLLPRHHLQSAELNVSANPEGFEGMLEWDWEYDEDTSPNIVDVPSLACHLCRA